MTNGQKVAVVLSGGAAYAAYEVGVLRALTEGRSPASGFKPLDADIFSGTSAGSFNAAIMISRPGEAPSDTAAYLEAVWSEVIAGGPDRCGNGVFHVRGDITRLFEPKCYSSGDPFLELAGDSAFVAEDFLARSSRIFASGTSLLQRALDAVELSSFISIEPFKKSLRETVDLDGIRRSSKVLLIAATNLESGLVDIFQNSFVSQVAGHEAIRASTAVPGFFPEVPIQSGVYVDGGVVMNTPISPAVNAGADVLHVIYMDPDLSSVPEETFRSTLGILDRVLTIHFANSMNNDIETASSINLGLQVARGKTLETLPVPASTLLRAAGTLAKLQPDALQQSRNLTIHRYHPQDDLGGILGMLDFDRKHLAGLVERGYHDAVNHDCGAGGCILEGLEAPVQPRRTIARYLGSVARPVNGNTRSSTQDQGKQKPGNCGDRKV